MKGRWFFLWIATTIALVSSSTAEKAPGVSLILSDVVAVKSSGGDIRFDCRAVLANDTGAELTVRSNFGSVFDGLEIVVTDRNGKILRQQPFTYHQSPRSQDSAFVLGKGRTEQILPFPVSGVGRAGGAFKVRLVGTLPGSAFEGILSSETLEVRPGRRSEAKSAKRSAPRAEFDGFAIFAEKKESDSVFSGKVRLLDTRDGNKQYAVADRAELKDGKLHLTGSVRLFMSIGGLPAGIGGDSFVLSEGRKGKMGGAVKARIDFRSLGGRD